jgi:aspartate carbamoyltransferase regulatory subunit
MTVNPIENGIVLDHIEAGRGMELYKILNLDELSCSVALIKNANSKKMGKKDIIKIDNVIDINFDIIGYVDPGITVNIIRNGINEKRINIEPPARVENVIKCKNPRCITSVEQELPHVFKLTDRKNMVYRCIYCESKAK